MKKKDTTNLINEKTQAQNSHSSADELINLLNKNKFILEHFVGFLITVFITAIAASWTLFTYLNSRDDRNSDKISDIKDYIHIEITNIDQRMNGNISDISNRFNDQISRIDNRVSKLEGSLEILKNVFRTNSDSFGQKKQTYKIPSNWSGSPLEYKAQLEDIFSESGFTIKAEGNLDSPTGFKVEKGIERKGDGHQKINY